VKLAEDEYASQGGEGVAFGKASLILTPPPPLASNFPHQRFPVHHSYLSASLRWLCLCLAIVSGADAFAAPRITEFMAANDSALADQDGEFSDWIEIQNPDATSISLAGYHLTDDAAKLTKWTFPAVTLAPGAYLVVFASGKDRINPASQLHTNFVLSAEGEYLGLVAPDGVTVVSSFGPSYPPQFDNVSFGLGQPGGSANVNLTPTWSSPGNYANVYITGAKTSNETAGADNLDLGIGGASSQAYLWFDFSSRLGQLPPSSIVTAATLSWRGVVSSTLIGSPTVDSMLGIFPVPDARHGIDSVAAAFTGRDVVDYYAAQTPAAQFNAVRGQTPTATWNVAPLVQQWVDNPVAAQRGQIMILNASRPMFMDWNVDAASKPLISLNVSTVSDPNAPPAWSYFSTPTPGAANNAGTRAGPIFDDATRNPPRQVAGPLIITAKLRSIIDPVVSVKLFYRRMFAAETMLAMTDDGTGGDVTAGDGIWTAVIPASAMGPGEMTRWRFVATDSKGTETREPAFRAALDSHEYFGTVAHNPATQSLLPVFEWFTSNSNAAGTTTGSRGAVYYAGEFYDNVLFNLHGQSTSGFPKKSYDVDFNRTQRFLWNATAPRVADINLLTNWADKSKVRHVFGYEVMRESGVHAHFAYTVRVQLNGNFFSTADIIEDADDIYLERTGLNPLGALYKMYATSLNPGDSIQSPAVEKKNGNPADRSDLQALVNGLALTNPALTNFLYDNIDIPKCVNLLAANSVIRNIDMHSKNWYLYRDTGRSNEWAILPWDLDLSAGRTWNTQNTYFDNALYIDGYVVTGNSIRLVSHLFSQPATRAMILRRIRTLSDRFLQPPPAAGTPESDLYYERRLNEQSAAIDPPGIVPSDAQRDFEKWGSWLQAGTNVPYTNTDPAVETMAEAVQRWKTQYLPGRRNYIYNTQVVGRGGEIPLPQATTGLVINFGTVEFSPASGNQDQEFIELINPNSIAMDVSGWRVTGGIDHTLEPGTVIPSNGKLYLSPNSAAFRARTVSPKGGEGRFVQGPYQGHLSNLGETLKLLDTAGVVNNTYTYVGNPTDAQRYLVVSEIMYQPPGNGLAEYIELANISPSVTLDLTGVHFTQGIDFSFTGSTITSLAPGARVLVVRDLAAFEAAYGVGRPVAGVFANATALSNGGELIKLEDGSNNTIREFTYDNAFPWPLGADGLGYSIVLRAPQTNPNHEVPLNWRASAMPGGTPGGTDELTLPVNPLADADGNGLSDLIDYAMGNNLGLPPIPAGFAVQSGAGGVSPTYLLSYPISLGAEGVDIKVLFSTNLTDWEDGSAGLTPVSIQPRGDGRAVVTWQVNPPFADAPHLFMRLQITEQ
jgi:hypothetical protein